MYIRTMRIRIKVVLRGDGYPEPGRVGMVQGMTGLKREATYTGLPALHRFLIRTKEEKLRDHRQNRHGVIEQSGWRECSERHRQE